MSLTGPQKYPPASLAYWYGDKYPGSAMETNVAVWHTTEGRTLPDYSGGSSAPNLTAVPDIPNRRLRWYQHFDIDRSSRALVNKSGGVETNTANAVQIELVGTCDRATSDRWGGQASGSHIFWPDAPDWALQQVGEFVAWLRDNHGVQVRSGVTWKAYPGSYGANGVRLSGSQWNAYYGHLGHQHVPENDHGDPGNINFARIIEHAIGSGQDVALTSEELKAIGRQVVTGANGLKSPTDSTVEWAVSSYLTLTYKAVQALDADVAAVKAKVDSLSTGGVDLDALAEKVADLLAARLAD